MTTNPSAPRAVRERRHVAIDERECPDLKSTIELVGRRWNASILVAAAEGARRFGEFRAVIGGISDRMLAQRLKELQAEELLVRTVIASTPVQIFYAPTEDALRLLAALQPLGEWTNARNSARTFQGPDTRA